MDINDFAHAVLAMNSEPKRKMAISNLENGLKKEPRWNEEHKKQVKALIMFLKSGSDNIEDLRSYVPSL